MVKCPIILYLFFTCSICYCQTDTIFITDDMPVLKIKANEPFILKFLACHSCGYNWSLDKIDTSVVKLIDVTSMHASGRNDIKGGSIYEFWKMKVIASGSYVLEFVYKRTWLKDSGKITYVELYVN